MYYYLRPNAGQGNVRPAGHIRPAKHLNVARKQHLKFSEWLCLLWNTLNIKKVPVLLQKLP